VCDSACVTDRAGARLYRRDSRSDARESRVFPCCPRSPARFNANFGAAAHKTPKLREKQ